MKKKFIFYGKVQSVGFRFRAEMLAKKYNIFGWVENNDNGSATLVAEGVKKDIESLINNLKYHFQDNIEDIKETIEKDEGLIDFKIK